MSDRIGQIYAAESRRVLATLVRVLGDIDRAEEAMQEAFGVALTRWPQDGIPANPRAWLVSVARNKGVDALRREARGQELLRREAAVAERGYDGAAWERVVVRDDQLRLLFTCCHPALVPESRIALALRVVCGLSTAEIARAFMVRADAMKRRISRAKATIREEQIPYEVPGRDALGDRLAAVLHVIYLVYNEAHSATAGPDHLRPDLARQAVNMARLVVDLLPEPEALGLLALVLLHESRSGSRTDENGDLVPLEAQDRASWDPALIAEGCALVQRSVMSGRMGAYVIQAAIASVHASADSVETTNWDLIVRYYDMLLALQDAPFVRMNRAIAVAMRDGPEAGIALMDVLLASPSLAEHHLAHAARADLARRAGRDAEAAAGYLRALGLVRQEPERRFLRRRLEEIEKKSGGRVPERERGSTTR